MGAGRSPQRNSADNSSPCPAELRRAAPYRGAAAEFGRGSSPTLPTSPERVSGGVPSSSGLGAWRRRASAGAPPWGGCLQKFVRLAGAAVFHRVRRLRRWRGCQGPSCSFSGHRGARSVIPAGRGHGRAARGRGRRAVVSLDSLDGGWASEAQAGGRPSKGVPAKRTTNPQRPRTKAARRYHGGYVSTGCYHSRQSSSRDMHSNRI